MFCRRDCDIGDLAAFAGTDPRPVPARVVEGDALTRAFWEENQSLEAYLRRVADSGRDPSCNMIAHLCWNISRRHWPPYAPPVGWGECVAAFRAALPDYRRFLDSSSHDAVRPYRAAYAALMD